MKTYSRCGVIVTLFLSLAVDRQSSLLASAGQAPTGSPASQAAQAAQARELATDADQRRRQLRDQERAIERRRRLQNGIVVSEPKVYDDALLQQMLNAAQARLATLQLIDQTGIAAKIGVLSGAEQQISGFALNVQTPSLPGVATTVKSPTGSTVTTVGGAVSTEGKPSSTTTTQTTSGLGTTDTATTAPQMAPPPATVAPPSTTLPSGMSVSASDLLNEQMQLTYEITNLRLLLDGAISDRMFADPAIQRVKPRTTIGVPVTIDPDNRYKGAVAIVELEIERRKTLSNTEEASITALLPREKTYNVAAIRDSSVSIGGGIVTQVVGVGGSWLRGRKTYFVVQDQDTVAMTFEPERPHTLGVAWQFRPVLGEEYVKGGPKQSFVQVAFPTAFTEKDFAAVTVRTYWRKYDRKLGVLKEIVPESLSSTILNWNVPTFPTTIPVLDFRRAGLEDLGGGLMLVNVGGRFLSGTSIRLGGTFVREGSPAMQFTHDGIKFVASINELAGRRVSLVGRDGRETPLVLATSAPSPPRIVRAEAVPLDEANSLLTVLLANDPNDASLVVVLGGRVFGYADAPLKRDGATLSASVPTAVLVASPSIKVTSLFAPESYQVSAAVEGLTSRSRLERLVLIGETADNATYLLYGSRLNNASVMLPQGAQLGAIGGAEDADTLRVVTLKKADLKTQKNLVLQRTNERPVLVPIPAADAAAAAPKPEPKARGRVVLNTDAAVFDSEGLKDLSKVVYDGRELSFEVSKDNKSVTVKGLQAAGVTTKPEIVTLEFSFGTSKVSAKLDVVNAKVEAVSR